MHKPSSAGGLPSLGLCSTSTGGGLPLKLSGGAGVVASSSSSVQYQGEIKDGKYHGSGTKIWPDGDRYEGEWRDGKRNGIGTFTWASGARYHGEWKDDKRNGSGTYFWLDGRKYEGKWQNGDYHGWGVYSWPDGRRYEGEWKEDKKNGKGVFLWANGDRYEGEWRDDKPNGRGAKMWAKGDRYEGEWNDGKQSGRGILLHPDGRSEDGTWENDLPHGEIVYTDEEGHRYMQIYRYGKILSTTPMGSSKSLEHNSVWEFRQFVDRASDWCRSFELMTQEATETKRRMEELALKAEEAVKEREREMRQHARDHKEWQQVIQDKAREAEEADKVNQQLARRVVKLKARCQGLKQENWSLLEGGRDDLSLEELMSLEVALERSRALVMKKIATLSLKKEIEEKNKCSVCMERDKEIAFIPCGHRTCCKACSDMLDLCPLCRERIASKLLIYD